ncbi:hypothetical protein DBR32_00760 [Taibaiella sp. KBW10]|uniref:TonB-dependent receptor plug domain-containing protein n=1 Tax=Taibaiella sp. KBW10 TaxID=2153357 RepID=UPI000F5A0331|nr:TonB-dependent receptor [Taibaiella sp. KBW10]RQO32178.1 hypothetical protein DBR32_00760 [Taibaiella sp. KBW10]
MRTFIYTMLCSAGLCTTQAQQMPDTTKQATLLTDVQVTAWRNDAIQKQYKTNDLQLPVDRLLERIKGVSMIRRGNFAMEPTLRGLSAAQINTTIDGMQVFGACTDRMDPVSSYVEPNNLESIQVSFGPNEAQYGTSVGGGLNFSLQKAKPNNAVSWTGLAGAGYETNAQAMQTIAALQYSGKRLALGANAVFRRAGNYTAGKGQEILFSQYNKWNLGLNGAYLLSQKHQLHFDYLQDEGYNIGYPALTMDVSFAKAKIGSISHVYESAAQKLYRWETKFYYNFIDHAMDDTKRPSWQVPIHMDMPGTSQTMGFYSKANWKLSNRHSFGAQLNAYDNKLHAEMTMYPEHAAEMFMLTLPDVRRTVAGLELSDKVWLTDRFRLSTGATLNYVRSDIYSEMGRQTLSSIFTGTLAQMHILFNAFVRADYQFNTHWSLQAGLARGERNASSQELYAFYLFNRLDNFDYIGNKDLKTERSWNANLGFSFHHDGLSIAPQLFMYRFEDYIVGQRIQGYSTMTIGASGVKQYRNIPNALLYGGELLASYQLLPELKIQSTNTISIGQDNEGRPLPLMPPFKSVNRLEYGLKGYGIYVESITQAKQDRVSTAQYGERVSNGFSILNAGLGKTFGLGHTKVNANVSVQNIFDKQYYEHLDILKLYRPGRNLVLNLTVLF